MEARTHANINQKELAKERKALRSQLSAALEEEEDPLAAYDRFVKWTMKNYAPGDPNSGLLDLLREATSKFMDDPSYAGDLRYLKLWSLYARHTDKPANVYAQLVKSGIGTSYSLLYEEYASTLEQEGNRSMADSIYQMGIKRQARPLERLKKRYREFEGRPSSSQPTGTTSSTDTFPKKHSNGSSSPRIQLNLPHNRYQYMLAPPVPDRRPERLRFNLSLLFTDEGVEYSGPEARARSMGLLGKTWAPPPPSELQSVLSTARVSFTDDPLERDRNVTTSRRRSLMIGEPTVTINTKEALADVFGMYNSPEKTRALPGSKHAPVKKIEPVTPIVRQPAVQVLSNENANRGVKTPGFRPFVDENIRKENTTPGPAKFKPFVDPELSKTPFTPNVSRKALSLKDVSAPTPAPRPGDSDNILSRSAFKPVGSLGLQPVAEESNAVSKVFTPAGARPQRDVFVDEQRLSQSPEADTPNPLQPHLGTSTFIPFTDPNARTPFKVFSRPPTSQNENVFTPKAPPFMDSQDESEQDDPQPLQASVEGPSQPATYSESNDEYDDEYDDEVSSGPNYEGNENDLPTQEAMEDCDEPGVVPELYHQTPLGGRFGQFNVMTPITERTFEFTMSTRGPITPRDQSGFLDKAMIEHGAVEAAERLAAELREEDEREEAFALSRGEFFEQDRVLSQDNTSYDEDGDSSFGSDEFHPPAQQPFRLSDGHTIELEKHLPHPPALSILEEKTGTLSLTDALAVVSSFRPPNPCNPFDPPIISTLLALLPPDSGFHDLRDRDANLSDGLQKWTQKRARRTSGTTGVRNDAGSYPLTLASRRFRVCDKLGEGGFGAVFSARDLGIRKDFDDGDDDEDEDEDDSPMIALKVVKPRNIWEFHVLRRIRSTLPASLRPSLVRPHDLYTFHDESFLVLDLSPQGTLLDVVNRAAQAGVSQQGACLDELLVFFFTIELLRLLEGLHSAGFIHGDLKIDNCLLRLEDVPGGAAAWSGTYQPSGQEGWSYKGVRVIDFGRTIDTGLFPIGQKFIAEWPTDARDCPEMREDKPWTFQTDYFGLAGIIYCMLFGKYIEMSSVVMADSRYKISTPFKRYWQSGIWSKLFDLLLNPRQVRSDSSLPLCEELGAIRGEMELWLQANCNRTSNTLKGLLKKIERSVWDSR